MTRGQEHTSEDTHKWMRGSEQSGGVAERPWGWGSQLWSLEGDKGMWGRQHQRTKAYEDARYWFFFWRDEKGN